MEVHPTPGQQAFIQQALESGRIRRPEDAVEEALSLWEEREKHRAEGYSRLTASEEASRQTVNDIAPGTFNARPFNQIQAKAAVAYMRGHRKQLPPGVTIRSMIDEGRD